MITEDKIILVTKDAFLRAFGISPNQKGFRVFEPTIEEFQEFLNQIRFNRVYKSKEFKKSDVPGIWTMYIVMKGLLGKHGGLDSMSKDCLYLVYNIFTSRLNTVDLPEVQW